MWTDNICTCLHWIYDKDIAGRTGIAKATEAVAQVAQNHEMPHLMQMRLIPRLFCRIEGQLYLQIMDRFECPKNAKADRDMNHMRNLLCLIEATSRCMSAVPFETMIAMHKA